MKWKEQGGWKEGGKVVDIYSAQEVQGESALRVGYWGVWLACPRKHETCGGATGMNIIEGR